MELGQIIQEKRKKAGLTQKELAEKVDVATITIQQYERNVREPKLETVVRIAEALNVSVSEFIPYGHPQNIKARYEAAKLRAEQYAKQTTRERINSGLNGLNEMGEEYILKQVHFARHIQEYCKPGVWTPMPINDEEKSFSDK